MKTILAIFSFFSIIFYNTSLYCPDDRRLKDIWGIQKMSDETNNCKRYSYEQAQITAKQQEADVDLLNYYIQKDQLYNRTKGRILFTLCKQGEIILDTDYEQYFVEHLREYCGLVYCVVEKRKIEYQFEDDRPKNINGRMVSYPSSMTAISSFEVLLNEKDLKP